LVFTYVEPRVTNLADYWRGVWSDYRDNHKYSSTQAAAAIRTLDLAVIPWYAIHVQQLSRVGSYSLSIALNVEMRVDNDQSNW